MALPRWQATVQDDNGNAVTNPSITVRTTSGALASIFDDAGLAKSNPFNGTVDGFVSFRAQAGRYTVQGVAGGQNAPDWVVDLVSSTASAVYSTRTDFVSVAGSDWDIGAIVTANGLEYIRVSGATAIPDLPGWLPDGDVFPGHFGATGSGDETSKLAPMLSWSSSVGRTVQWDGDYTFSEWDDTTPSPRVKWRSTKPVMLSSNKTAPTSGTDFMVRVAADTIANNRLVTATVTDGSTVVSLDSTAGMTPGSMLIFFSTRMIETDHRGQARHGVAIPIERVISGTQVELQRPMPFTGVVGNVNGAVTAVIDATTIEVSGLSSVTTKAAGRYQVLFTSGAATGTTVFVVDWDPVTSRMKSHTSNSVFPGSVAIGDTFTLVRKIDVYHTYPSAVDIQGDITLNRALTINATSGDAGYQGLYVSRGNGIVIDGLKTNGFSETGIRLYHCYGHNIRNINASYSNRAYNGFDGTGYGVACEQSSFGVFENINGFACRRTLDFGGTQGASYYNETSNIRNYGGGTGYNGVAFWPNGATEQSVVGSHGAAFGTKYTNSYGIHTYGVLNCRGDNEFANGVFGCGAVDRMVNDFSGGGVVVDGIHYRSWGYEWGVLSSARIQPSNPAHKLKQFIVITPSEIIRSKPRLFSNITGAGVTYSVLSFINGGDIQSPIFIRGMNVIADNESGTDGVFRVVRRGGTGSNKLASVYLDGILLNDPVYPKTDITWIDQGNFTTWDHGSVIRLPTGSRMIYMADDSVVALPCNPGGTNRLSLVPYNANRAFRILDAVIWAGQTGDKAPVTNALAVDVLATALTGTTGTDGRFSISRVSNTLYIENRFGSAQWVLLDCDTLV